MFGMESTTQSRYLQFDEWNPLVLMTVDFIAVVWDVK